MISKVKLTRWAKNNTVLLVCVPLIVGVHWGWYKIQDVPYLVKPSEKLTEMPIITALKTYATLISKKFENVSKEQTSVAVEK